VLHGPNGERRTRSRPVSKLMQVRSWAPGCSLGAWAWNKQAMKAPSPPPDYPRSLCGGFRPLA